MNDTKKMIKKYKGMLPNLKEKVAAVSVLLAMSATMLTTVSFAWLALSKSPEATAAHTAIASNGNLEIALATGTMTDWITPDPSQVGDGALVLNDRNITWGNLVNLSDPIYGLDNLVLRPARLNKTNLLGSPLYGAVYGKDGRIEKLTSNFGFASWVPSDGVTSGFFEISDNLGVRAISSTKMDSNVGPYATNFQLKKAAAVEANATAGSAYISLTNNEAWMQSLATLMGKYMTVRMNAGQGDENLLNPSITKEDVENLRDMFGAFVDVFEMEAEALAALANFQLFVIHGGDETKYAKYTGETLLAKTQAELKAQGIQISDFQGSATSFVSDYAKIKADYEQLVELAKQGDITWKDENGVSILNSMINDLVAVGSCTVQQVGSSETPQKIDSIGATAALGLNNKSCNAVITNGLLKRFEERTGEHMKVGQNYNNGKGLKIVATGKRLGMTMDGTVYAIITTNAGNNSLFAADVKLAESLNTGEVGSVVAKDTYGLAVDLWVRTNAAGSYLTLQGNVLTKEEEVQVMGKDAEGNEVEIYVLTLSDPNDSTVTYTIDLYQMDGAWYDADSHQAYTLESGQSPKKKYEIIKTVIGYEGANRVWDEGAAGLTVNSTTQGSGSCYVYYADTPEDQARSLALLSNLKVAFIDGEGTLLAEAYLDSNNFYAENGKVTVPLVLDPTSCVNLGTDAEGNSILAITALEQNVATRVSAIIYLDGANLNNEDVLSSSEIQGQMNIQFGSTANLTHFDNEKLKQSQIKISASILEGTSFDYDTIVGDMLTKVGVTVEGDQPKTVTAFFLRMISSTQGSREKAMTFTYNESTKQWEATHKFLAPGNYILRSVQLDGVEYDLDQENRPTVTIKGFTIKSLNWAYGNEEATILTADSSVSESLSIEFASHDEAKMPKSVLGQFVRKSDGTVASVKFTYNPTTTTWQGNISFASSGEYTLTYLVLDGRTDPVPESMQKKITIYLGMKVAVYTNSPVEFLYEGNSMPDNQKNLYMQVRIMDDTGVPMNGQQNVSLRYKMKGSSLNENGMYAELTWNPNSGYYEGAFKSKVGMYEFSSVSVGGNTITRDTTSPEFMIVSPVPPSFDSGNTPDYQYAPEGKATLSVILNDADALPYIKATLLKTKPGEPDKTFLVDGTPGADGVWNFAIPAAELAEADGYWSIQDIRIAGVYSTDGVAYTEENPLIFDMTGVDKVSTKVVATINVSFGNQANQIFGKTGNTINGTFMQEHTVSRFYVIFTDFENNPVEGIKDVKIKLSYDGKSLDYGGYSGALTTETDYTLAGQGDNKTFEVSDIKLRTAGVYRVTALTFNVQVGGTQNGGSVNDLSNAPHYEVWSQKPTVKITARSNYGSSSNTDTSATVYFNTSTNTTCGITTTNYSQPYVTLTLAGYGNASGATMTFVESNGGTVHLYSSNGGTSAISTYSWTGNGTCQRWVGYYKSVSAGNDNKTAAGSLTATTLVLTYDNVSYTVDVADISINNPS